MKKISQFVRLILPLALCLAFTSLDGLAQALPFHLPKGAGSFRLGVVCGEESRWIDECDIKQEGVHYTIKDNLWKGGKLRLVVCPLPAPAVGFIVKVDGEKLPQELQLCWAFGGCNGVEDPAVKDNLIPTAACRYNVHSTEGNAFTTYYGASMRLRTTHGVMPIGSEMRLSDGHQQSSPLALYHSGKKTDAHVIAALYEWEEKEACYFCLFQRADYNYFMLPEVFEKAYKNAR